VEMNVSVVDLSANQKKLQVQIAAQEVQGELDKRYRELAKEVRIKGFRPGKVPRNILKSYYGKAVEGEVSSQFIKDSFPEALRQSELKPLVEADVDEVHFDPGGTFTYVAVLDVSPAFEVEGYKGLELQRPPLSGIEEQMEAELDKLRQQHAQLRTLETNRPIREDDMVLIDLTPTIDGVVFEKGKMADHMTEVGKNVLHPDFDDHLIGHRAGDEVSFDLDYPPNAQPPEVAGKTVHFDVTIRELKEKIVPDLDEEFAQEVGKFDTLEALKEEVRKQVVKREESNATSAVHDQIVKSLLAKTQFELSQKVIDREVDRLLDIFLHQFKTQGLEVDPARFNTPEMRAGYRPQAEKGLQWSLIAHHIAKLEGLDLTSEEEEETFREVAAMFRMDVGTFKQEHSESAVIAEAKEAKIQEKVLKFLEEQAVFTEPSTLEEGKSPEQE